MAIVECKIYGRSTEYPKGVVEIECSDQDAHWIKELVVTLGAGNHPCGVLPDGSIKSLARQVLQRYNIPVDIDAKIFRVDITQPLNVSHDNLCVPLDLLPHRDCLDGVRSVVLADWLDCFINSTKQKLTEPVTIQCLDIEKIQPVFFQGDADDVSWLDGKPVKFSATGVPLVQLDWGKFVPIMSAQAKRYMPDRSDLTLRRLSPHTPLDIRKQLILSIAPNGRMWSGMTSPR